MNTHTPGPWKIRAEEADEEYWVTEDHYTVGPAKIVYKIEDARLIAAAPELLEALKGVLRVADRKTDEFDAARAAINKATGG